MQNTVTPVKLSGISLIVNIVLNLLLMHTLKASGLALANSIAAISHAILLYVFLTKRIGKIVNREFLYVVFKISTASIIMGAVCFFTHSVFKSILPYSKIYSIINLFVSIFISIATYSVSLHLFGLKDVKSVFLWILRKK